MLGLQLLHHSLAEPSAGPVAISSQQPRRVETVMRALAITNRSLQSRAGRGMAAVAQRGMDMNWKRMPAVTAVSLFLFFAPSAFAQSEVPTMPACIERHTYVTDLPQATTHVRFQWNAFVMGGITDVVYHVEGYTDRYNYHDLSLHWSATLTDAAGNPLTTHGGTTTIVPYTYPCNYFTSVGCEAVGDVVPTSTGGEEFVDVSAVAAQGDSALTVTVEQEVGHVTWTRTTKTGQTTTSETCSPLHPSAQAGAVVPSVSLPQIWAPMDHMITIVAPEWDRNHYTSFFQRRSTDFVPNIPLGVRPQFIVDNVDASQLPAGSPAWFRVIDPPDSALYADHATPGDNHDAGGGTLYLFDGRSAPLGTPISIMPDSAGRIDLVLEGSAQSAGDNYNLLASADPPDSSGHFPCEWAGNCASTGVVSVWKRLYYEHVHMPKAGAFLAKNVSGGDSTACSDSSPCTIHVRSVAVNGTDVIVPGASLTLIGTNGGDAPGQSNPPTEEWSEAVTVDQDSPTLGAAVTARGTEDFAVRLTSRPLKDYSGGAARRTLYDAVVPATDIWEADLSGVEAVLADAFIEYEPAPFVDLFPYVGTVIDDDFAKLARWLPRGQPNVRFLVASDRYPAFGSPCGTHLGDRPRGTRYAFVYVGTINGATASTLSPVYPALTARDQPGPGLPSGCGGTKLPRVFGQDGASLLYEATAHEMVHQFDVDQSTGGHCSVASDFTGKFKCLMDSAFPASAAKAQVDGFVINLHVGPDSEYATMRNEHDPSQ
jgi:hypothetical protein